MDILSMNVDSDLLTIQYGGEVFQRRTINLANIRDIDVVPITDISIILNIPIIWEYDWLTQFYNLERLSIRGIPNNVELVKDLHLLPNIDTIILDNIGMREFPDISLLDNLRELDVSNNYIPLISLNTQHDLAILSINNNQLSSLDGLEVFHWLEELHADDNRIRDITTIVGTVDILNGLYHLSLNDNRISDASILDTLITEPYQLYRIILTNNRLTNEGLPMVILDRSNIIIDARDNPIDELPIAYIENMTGVGSWELLLTINGNIDSDRLNEIITPYQGFDIEDRWLIQSDGTDVRIFYSS